MVKNPLEKLTLMPWILIQIHSILFLFLLFYITGYCLAIARRRRKYSVVYCLNFKANFSFLSKNHMDTF